MPEPHPMLKPSTPYKKAKVYSAMARRRTILTASPEAYIFTRRLTKHNNHPTSNNNIQFGEHLQRQDYDKDYGKISMKHPSSVKAKNLNLKQQRRAATLQHLSTLHTLRYYKSHAIQHSYLIRTDHDK